MMRKRCVRRPVLLQVPGENGNFWNTIAQHLSVTFLEHCRMWGPPQGPVRWEGLWCPRGEDQAGARLVSEGCPSQSRPFPGDFSVSLFPSRGPRPSQYCASLHSHPASSQKPSCINHKVNFLLLLKICGVVGESALHMAFLRKIPIFTCLLPKHLDDGTAMGLRTRLG